MACEKGLVGVQEGDFLRGERRGVCGVCEVGDGVFGLLVGWGRLLGGGGGLGVGGAGGDEEEVVHAVGGEFGEALAEERADEVLGAGEVGLEDREFEVECGIVRRGCGEGVG